MQIGNSTLPVTLPNLPFLGIASLNGSGGGVGGGSRRRLQNDNGRDILNLEFGDTCGAYADWFGDRFKFDSIFVPPFSSGMFDAAVGQVGIFSNILPEPVLRNVMPCDSIVACLKSGILSALAKKGSYALETVASSAKPLGSRHLQQQGAVACSAADQVTYSPSAFP